MLLDIISARESLEQAKEDIQDVSSVCSAIETIEQVIELLIDIESRILLQGEVA